MTLYAYPEIANINRKKYAKPPTWEQIQELMDEMKMGQNHFERFYGIPYNTLTQIKSGKLNLAPNYWHYIYEKIKPNYGVGSIEEANKKIMDEARGIVKKVPAHIENKKPVDISDAVKHHSRLAKLL